MINPHKITKDFEEAVAQYTGAPYAVAVDNESNALYLCLEYQKRIGFWDTKEPVEIPKHTYVSVPCEIIRAGGTVEFMQSVTHLTGPYFLGNTRIVDSALRFTYDMYVPCSLMCLSFTGPYKHLKLGKGGMILTDDEEAYKWFKRARFSGRREMSYHEDNLDMMGINCYMMPEIAARGLLLMGQFYDKDGNPKKNDDITLPYPDLSKFPIYKNKTLW